MYAAAPSLTGTIILIAATDDSLAMSTPPTKKRKERTEDDMIIGTIHENAADQNIVPLTPPRQRMHTTMLPTPRSPRHTREDVVTLAIGPDEEELVAMGHHLARHSKFFQAALKKEWAEGRNRIVKMPEEDIESVKRYLDFLCDGEMPSKFIEELEDYAPDGGLYEELCELYVFGERVLDARLRNDIVREIIRLVSILAYKGHLPSDDCVATIYAGTPAGAPARRLMVDLHVHYGLLYCSKTLNQEYVVDVVNGFLQRAIEGDRSYDFRWRKPEAVDYLV